MDDKELLKQIEELTNKLNASKVNKFVAEVGEGGFRFEILTSELDFKEAKEEFRLFVKKYGALELSKEDGDIHMEFE